MKDEAGTRGTEGRNVGAGQNRSRGTGRDTVGAGRA